MSFMQVIFTLFSAVTIGSALMVITSRNPVHCALYLVLAFVSTSGLWILLQAEFLAMILVLVYVGAVMVLFLFVVMMLDINMATIKEGFTRFLPFAIVLAALLVGQIIWALGTERFGIQHYTLTAHAADYSDTKVLGKVLYTHYAYPFELAALLLLVAMIAAVTLTFRGVRERKSQHVAKQVLVKKADRLRIVKLTSTTSDSKTES